MRSKQVAFEALKIEVNESNTFWDSYDALNELLPTFITGDEDDNDWINTIINFVGHDYYMFKIWFEEQSTKSDDWSQKQFELITKWNKNLKNCKNGKF